MYLQVLVPTIEKTLYLPRQTQSLKIHEELLGAMCGEFESYFVNFMLHCRVMSLDSGSMEFSIVSQMLDLSLAYTQNLMSQRLRSLCSGCC